MRYETILADPNKIADEGVRLNPAAFPDRCAFLNLDEWAYEAVISNGATVEIDRLNDGDVLAKVNIDNTDMSKYWPAARSHPTSLALWSDCIKLLH